MKVRQLFEDFKDGLEMLGDYLWNIGEPQVMESITANGRVISLAELGNRSVVQYFAEEQKKAQERPIVSYSARDWEAAFNTPIKPRPYEFR